MKFYILNTLIILLFVINLHAMEKLLTFYGQDTINKFDEQKHFDPGLYLHYGFIYGFAKDVSHTGFEPCSVQEGLKRGQNIYVDDDNQTLVITKNCTHWIDIPAGDKSYNKKQLKLLIVAINSLNKNTTGKQCPRFNTIQIQIDSIDLIMHRYSTCRFNLYYDACFFKKLKDLKNIYYVPAIKEKMTSLFVDQEIIKHDGKNYYYPFVLIEDKKHTVLLNGIINKRERENKDVCDVIFFTCADEDIFRKYSVTVHPDIVIQEVVRGQLCDDGIHALVGNPPELNEMQRYPLWLLAEISRQYGIHITLLVNSDQRGLLDWRIRSFNEGYFNNISLEECSLGKYCYISENNLVIHNSNIRCMKWVKEREGFSCEQLYNSLLTKLYFLCWLKNINTITIEVPESYPDDPDADQIDLHSLAVLSSDSLNLLRCLPPVVKTIRYAPYDFIRSGYVNNCFLYIHENVASILPLKINKELNQNYTISDSLTLTVEKNVEMKPFAVEKVVIKELPAGPVINNNNNRDEKSKKSNLAILSSIVFKLMGLSILFYFFIFEPLFFNKNILAYSKKN